MAATPPRTMRCPGRGCAARSLRNGPDHIGRLQHPPGRDGLVEVRGKVMCHEIVGGGRSVRDIRGGEMTTEDAITPPRHSLSLDVPAWVQDSALLDAIAAAVVATDTAGTIFYFNAAAEQLYGYPREEMLGANVMQLLVEPVDQVPAAVIMETVLAGERWSGRFRVRRQGGSNIVVRITDTPITEQGRVVGVIGVAEPVADDQFDGSIPVTPHIESAALRLAEQMRQA